MKRYLKCLTALLLCLTMLSVAGCGKKETKNNEFKPSLDTDAKVVINVSGFFGNFEALDQVTNDFNQFYPNVEFSYEQLSVENFESYMEANPGVDIVMTSEEVFDKYGDNLKECFVDLSKEDINLSDIREDMLKRGYHDGKLLSVPMGQNIYGIVVNETLLEKEGLSVPGNYEEFLNALSVLKDKGYVPIQGPTSKVYAELTQGMAYDMIMNDKNLYNDLIAGKDSAADKLQTVYDKLDTLINSGYIDNEVNKTYPSDNYDKAILKFFEGNVPFWVCNTEKVSGMKKRESKSEAFQANPFKYTYIYSPLGDNGVYAYTEPWFGFSVNKNSDDYDYAVEFMRFMSTKDEINKMASIKGIPSVAINNTDADIYKNVINPEKTEMNCVNDGTISSGMISNWYTCVNKYISGEFKTGKDALRQFVSLSKK
ncbi:MAG: ABC transporter substrate-binding protein [Eubacteriales bacterium]|nr:ABC transporter substrate-binding protein [Eubacteriales bacterium]